MRRIALDSMPARHSQSALSKDQEQTTARIVQLSGLHWQVAHRHAENMAAIGVVDPWPRCSGPVWSPGAWAAFGLEDVATRA